MHLVRLRKKYFDKHLNNVITFSFLTGLITYINLVSVKLFVKINNIFGFCKVAACIIVILGGIYQLIKGNSSNLESGFKGTNLEFGSIALALYSGLW